MPITLLSPEESLKILLRWKEEGPTDEEREEFRNAALAQLADSKQIKDFEDNFRDMAKIAAQIEATFVDVEHKLWVIVWLIWPIGITLLQQWVGFRERWRSCLHLSVEMAVTTADILKRFDEVYLAKVENIQTEQDRVAAIQALEPFIGELEKNDKSAEMSRQFLDLKRDIAAFVNQFNMSATATAIEPLLKSIELLDQQIKFAQAAVGGGLLRALRLDASTPSVIASLQAQRQKRAEGLKSIHSVMTAINNLVVPRVLDEQIVAPDINLMLENLVVFAEIWSSVRNQSVQFTEHMKGGLEASTNMRFKSEVRLARAACTPLRDGLMDYKRQLESWI